MDRQLPRKRRYVGEPEDPQVAEASRPTDFGEIATEQFDTPKRTDQHVPAANLLNNFCGSLGWTAEYTYPAAGVNADKLEQCFARLELRASGRTTVQVFDHKRPEIDERIAKTEVAERALRWTEVQKIASSLNINQSYLNLYLSNYTGNLRSNPNFSDTSGLLLAFAQARFSKKHPLIAHHGDNLANHRRSAQNKKYSEAALRLTMNSQYSQTIANSAQALNDYQKPPKGARKLTFQALTVLQNAFDDYRAGLVPEDNPTLIVPCEKVELLQHLREDTLTMDFESITEPLARLRFTDFKDHAAPTRTGIELAEAILNTVRLDITVEGASSMVANILAGMQKILIRADWAFTPPPPSPDAGPETQTTQPSLSGLSKSEQIAAVDSIAEQLNKSWVDDADEELLFNAFGAWLMLRLEEYPKSIALAFRYGFQLVCGEWVEHLVHKEAEKDGMGLEDVYLRATGPPGMVPDVPSKATDAQRLQRENERQKAGKPGIAVPKTSKRATIARECRWLLHPEEDPRKSPTLKKQAAKGKARRDPNTEIASSEYDGGSQSKISSRPVELTAPESRYVQPFFKKVFVDSPTTQPIPQFDDISLQQKRFPSDTIRNRCIACSHIGHGQVDCPFLNCGHCGMKGNHSTLRCAILPQSRYPRQKSSWLSRKYRKAKIRKGAKFTGQILGVKDRQM